MLVYGRRNARILYDALGTLAEAVHGALAEPMFLGVIMPPLVQVISCFLWVSGSNYPQCRCFAWFEERFSWRLKLRRL